MTKTGIMARGGGSGGIRHLGLARSIALCLLPLLGSVAGCASIHTSASRSPMGAAVYSVPTTMRPPAGATEPNVVYSLQGNVIPRNANGTFTVSDQRSVMALLNTGWTVLTAPAVAVTATSLSLSASAGAYGSPVTVLPSPGYQALDLRTIDFSMTAGAAETLTCEAVATYQDATTATRTIAHIFGGSGSSDQPFALNDLAALYTTAKYTTQVAYACKSSISSSTATVALTAVEISE